jgi:protease-4
LYVLLFFLLALFLFFYFAFGIFTPSDSLTELNLGGGDKIGLVKIIGPIYDARPILDQLDKVEEIPSIKGILLRLDTPGGGVAASQEIYQKLRYLRDEKQIPIVASMGSVAASGGYYVALGADTIMANPGTVTGSIGVIGQFPEYAQLLKKIGVEVQVVKSGEFKDTGSPSRPLTQADKAYLQNLIMDIYRQFLDAIVAERNISLERVEQLADGRVYTGRQAEELELIDLIGTYDDALRLVGKMAGISGKPRLVELQRKKMTLLDFVFGDLEEMLFLRWGLSIPLRYELP